MFLLHYWPEGGQHQQPNMLSKHLETCYQNLWAV